MKKYLYFIVFIIGLYSCSEENTNEWNYAPEDVKLIVEIPDTLYVGRPAVFSSIINVPLPVTFYIGSVPEKVKIGIIEPPKGNFSWIPGTENIAAGKQSFSAEVVISNDGEGKINVISRSKDVIIN